MSDAKKETLADIVSEMRNFACELKGTLGPKSNWSERTDRADDFARYADRIEAALKYERGIMHNSDKWDAFVQGQAAASYWRERCHDAEERERKGGDAAKLRWALEGCRVYLYDRLRYAFYEAQVASQSDNPELEGYDQEQQLHKEVEAALAAPPRNCDRFATAHDAMEYYLANLSQETGWEFCKWLFDVETPEKGVDLGAGPSYAVKAEVAGGEVVSLTREAAGYPECLVSGDEAAGELEEPHWPFGRGKE